MIGHSFPPSGVDRAQLPPLFLFSLNILFFNIGVGVLFVFW